MSNRPDARGPLSPGLPQPPPPTMPSRTALHQSLVPTGTTNIVTGIRPPHPLIELGATPPRFRVSYAPRRPLEEEQYLRHHRCTHGFCLVPTIGDGRGEVRRWFQQLGIGSSHVARARGDARLVSQAYMLNIPNNKSYLRSHE